MRSSVSRRQLLLGSGGFSLALPFLPSVLPRSARAGVPRGGERFFVGLASHHGGVWAPNMYPDERNLSSAGRYAGRQIRSGPLSGSMSGGQRRLSPVLRASASRLSSGIVEQMNVIQGLDVPWYIAHHSGGHLGNFARNDGNGSDGLYMQAFPTPTIDQVMGWSDRFYRNHAEIVERVMVIGGSRISYNYANPVSKQGGIQAQLSYTSSVQLFQRVFDPAAAFGAASPLVVDRVLENYQQLMSDPRLSAGDARRLDEHMERLFEVERRLTREVSCRPADPTFDAEELRHASDFFRDPGSQAAYWQLMNDVIVAAFSCGVSRIAAVNVPDTFSTFSGDWHQDIAHQAISPDGGAQEILVDAHQQFFEQVFLDLVEKLHAVETADGERLLDRALVVWSQESGQIPHESFSIPVVTAGSAGGSVATGQHIDYRDLTVPMPYEEDTSGQYPVDYPGLLWNQYLGTILQVMGVAPETYEAEDVGGYGPLYIAEGRDHYDAALPVAGELLPLLTP